MIKLARENHRRRAGSVGMRCAEQDTICGQSGSFLHELAGRVHGLTTKRQGVNSHDGHALLPVVEYCGPYFRWIMDYFAEGLSISAGVLHSGIREDFEIREPSFELRA